MGLTAAHFVSMRNFSLYRQVLVLGLLFLSNYCNYITQSPHLHIGHSGNDFGLTLLILVPLKWPLYGYSV